MARARERGAITGHGSLEKGAERATQCFGRSTGLRHGQEKGSKDLGFRFHTEWPAMPGQEWGVVQSMGQLERDFTFISLAWNLPGTARGLLLAVLRAP